MYIFLKKWNLTPPSPQYRIRPTCDETSSYPPPQFVLHLWLSLDRCHIYGNSKWRPMQSLHGRQRFSYSLLFLCFQCTLPPVFGTLTTTCPFLWWLTIIHELPGSFMGWAWVRYVGCQLTCFLVLIMCFRVHPLLFYTFFDERHWKDSKKNSFNLSAFRSCGHHEKKRYSGRCHDHPVLDHELNVQLF